MCFIFIVGCPHSSLFHNCSCRPVKWNTDITRQSDIIPRRKHSYSCHILCHQRMVIFLKLDLKQKFILVRNNLLDYLQSHPSVCAKERDQCKSTIYHNRNITGPYFIPTRSLEGPPGPNFVLQSSQGPYRTPSSNSKI